MFGFEACAYTNFFPGSGSQIETETWAYELSRRGAMEPVADYDRPTWEAYGLDEPDLRQKYRDQVELGRLLTCSTSCLYCNTPLVRQRTAEVKAPFSVWTWN